MRLLICAAAIIAAGALAQAQSGGGGALDRALSGNTDQQEREQAQDNLGRDRINQQRLSCLCEFLRDHGDWFEVTTMGQLASASPLASSADNMILKVPMLYAIGRMVQNSLNDRIAAL